MVGVSDQFPFPHRLRTRRRVAVGSLLAALTLGVTAGCSSLTSPQPDPVLKQMLALSLRDAESVGGEPADMRATQAEALQEEIARSCGTHRDGSAPEECVAPPAPAAEPTETPERGVELSHQSQLLLNSLEPSEAMENALDDRNSLREDYSVYLASSVTGGIVLAARESGVEWSALAPVFPEGTELSGSDAELLTQALDAEYALIYGMGVAAPRVDADRTLSTETSADRHRQIRDEVVRVLGGADEEIPVPAPGYRGTSDDRDVDENPVAYAAALEQSAAGAWRTVLAEARSPQVRQFALQAAGVSEAGAAVFNGQPVDALPGFGAAVSPASPDSGEEEAAEEETGN